jgi:enoyl-CoA hydratase
VPRRWRVAPEVLEEGLLRAEHLDRARRQAGEALETSGLGDQTRGEIGAQQPGKIRSLAGGGCVDRLFEQRPGLFHRPVQLGELPSGFPERRVGRPEPRVRGPGERRLDDPGVVPRIEVRYVARDPTSEPLAEEVPDAVEVGERPDRLLEMDGRVPRGLEGPFGVEQESRTEGPAVGVRPRENGRSRGRRAPSQAMIGQATVSGLPLAPVAVREDGLLFRCEPPFASRADPIRQRSGIGRRAYPPDDGRILQQERPDPRRDDRTIHGAPNALGINRRVRPHHGMVSPGPTELVRRERRGRTVVLTLDHPPVNVLSRAVLDALTQRLEEVGRDPEARVVVLASAAARAFAAGADIREMAPMGPGEARTHGARGQGVARRIERLPLPVIAAVHGVCLGGGCEIALACDFIVASEDATFGQPEINLGVMPGWGGTQRLPLRIGALAARRWILTGRSVRAPEAHAAGLTQEVVPRAELLPAALRLATELAAKPPVALAAAKYAVNHAIAPELDAGLSYELDLWARLFGTADQKRGMRAFLEKTPLEERSRTDWDSESRGFPWAGAEGSAPSGKRNKPEASDRA